MPDRLVLAMDGSTNVATAALLEGQRVLARRVDTEGRGQARVLLRQVDDMLRELGRDAADLGAIVVGNGPGTFTGVRIAVATARGLALALDIPVLGVSTLSALTAQAAARGAGPAGEPPRLLVPVVDARRGQLFYGVYRRAADAEVYVRTEPFAVCDRDALVSMVAPGDDAVLFVGEVGDLGGGAAFVKQDVTAEFLVVGQDHLAEPGDGPEGSRLHGWLADALGREGARWTGGAVGEAGSPEGVKPIYVRSPDADIHITKMRDPWAETTEGR